VVVDEKKEKNITMSSPKQKLFLNGFEQLVGNTPLVRLTRASQQTSCEIYGKAEFCNPGGSIKDRAALWMIRDAEHRNILKRGERGIIVEGTAGNTGIGLALAATTFGYETVICIANTQSEEKKNTLRWAGAHLVEVPAVPFKDKNNYVHVAERLAENLRANGVRTLYANQWDNLANMQAHIDGTGPEIIKQLSKELNCAVDAFSCAAGTGGTVHGMSKYLKTIMNNQQENYGVTPIIGLTDPKGGALVHYFNHGELKADGSSISEGIGQGRITGNLKGFKPDVALEVCDDEMMDALIGLQETDGLLLGGSSGINVAGTIKLAKTLGWKNKVLVTVLCDLGTRYSAKLLNPGFLKSKGLIVPPWLDVEKQNEKFTKIYGLHEATKKSIL
jgi:cysteine synthase A